MGWAKSLKKSVKVKNHHASKPAKIEIRRNLLDVVGTQAAVFDAFAGTGEMYRAVWQHAAGYVGCDLEWSRDDRLAYVADNRRVLRAVDLRRFSIFDLDAFGSPWEQALIVAARRPVEPGERVGLALTEGTSTYLRQGGLPLALAELTGMTTRLPGLQRWQGAIIDKAISGIARRMRCSLERRWEAKGTSGAAVRYIGLVLVGQPSDVAAPEEGYDSPSGEKAANRV